MSKSKIFHTNEYKRLEKSAKELLVAQLANGKVEELIKSTSLVNKSINNPRAFGEVVEKIFSENFESILGDLCKEYKQEFERRALEDFAFTGKDDYYYAVDVKTNRLDAKFNRPNLTSVQRLSKFYEDDKNFFVILKVDYRIDCSQVLIEKVTFVPVEFISWDSLTIGTLGWGQIQIANAKDVHIVTENKRKKWMIKMCKKLKKFYPKEILKFKNRKKYFKKVMKRWKEK